MKVMIPVDNTKEIGLRDVIDAEEVDKVMLVLRQECTAMSTNWNRRYRSNLEKIKSGDIYEVADVVRNLFSRERRKAFRPASARCLTAPKRYSSSELILAKNWDREKTMSVLEDVLMPLP
jgi:CarD family transcriptional regulator